MPLRTATIQYGRFHEEPPERPRRDSPAGKVISGEIVVFSRVGGDGNHVRRPDQAAEDGSGLGVGQEAFDDGGGGGCAERAAKGAGEGDDNGKPGPRAGGYAAGIHGGGFSGGGDPAIRKRRPPPYLAVQRPLPLRPPLFPIQLRK